MTISFSCYIVPWHPHPPARQCSFRVREWWCSRGWDGVVVGVLMSSAQSLPCSHSASLLVLVVVLHAGLAVAIKILFFSHGSPAKSDKGDKGDDRMLMS